MSTPTRTRPRAAVAWPLANAVAYAVALGLVYVLTVRTVRGRLFSEASLRGAISSRSSLRDTVDAILDVVSVGSLLGAVAVVAVIALVRLDRVRGLAAVGALCSANVATWLLKEHLLSRPDLGLDEVGPSTLNSLPSGHATAAFSAVAALLVVLPARGRPLVAVVGGGYAAATALATMLAGWHRAADAMAAFLVVGVCTMLAALLVIRATPPTTATSRVPLRWAAALAIGALALGLAMSLGLSAASPLRDTLLGSLLALVSAGLLIVGTLIAVLGSLLRGLEAMDGG